jgi:membrane fusion protein (multidrug efflux system)
VTDTATYTATARTAASGDAQSRGSGLRPVRDAPNPSQPARALVLAAIGFALVACVAAQYWRSMGWESTDNAQIDGFIYPVSSRISGHVTRVMVDENQYVEPGTVLAQLDAKSYEVAVAIARATLANDEASAAALRTNLQITSTDAASQLSTAEGDAEHAQRQFEAGQARLRESEASDLKAQDAVTRYRRLATRDEIYRQPYRQAVNDQRATAAAVAAAGAVAEAAEQAVTQARARRAQAQAQWQSAGTWPDPIAVQRARALAAEAETQRAAAALHEAQLNRQYTTIVAPVAGLVGERAVQPGHNVSAGQQLMTIVPLDGENIWVTAQFKETQLKYMRPGQPAILTVAAYGRTYQGRVLNIAAASGAHSSLLPPENATGSYARVIHRIPVTIGFDEGQDAEHLLRLGMSVEPRVRVR